MFEWTPLMRIDNGQIDEDHQKLILIANRILALKRPSQDVEELKQLIRELYDYVKYHFSREEALMHELEYPRVDEHIEKHAIIIRDMNGYLTHSHHLVDILNNFHELVDRWVISHIMEEDRKIRQFMVDRLAAAQKGQ